MVEPRLPGGDLQLQLTQQGPQRIHRCEPTAPRQAGDERTKSLLLIRVRDVAAATRATIAPTSMSAFRPSTNPTTGRLAPLTWWEKIAPSAATPVAIPTCRKVELIPLAMPARTGSTTPTAVDASGTLMKPAPTPATRKPGMK